MSNAPINTAKQHSPSRESNVPWLGAIPTHWEVRRLKGVAKIQTGGKDTLHRKENGEYPFFIRSQTAERIDTWCHDGEAVLTAGDGAVGEIFHYVNGKFDCHQRVYMFYDFSGVQCKFFFHYFRATLRHETDQGTAKATVESLRLPMLQNFPIVLPPLKEQAAIVRYLDQADEQIQAYISAKQRLIALLEEQRQAIIHQAVTRGLDPNVKLRPSGVEWLGDVPEHWEIRRLRYLLKDKLKYGANQAAEYTQPNWPRYLRITDFSADGTLKEDDPRSLPPEIALEYLVEPGDLLFARSGATVGKTFLVPPVNRKMCHAGYLIRARPDQQVADPRFVFAFTQSRAFHDWRSATLITATIENINAEKYAGLRVPTPPRDEQNKIADFLGIVQSRTENNMEAIRHQIGLMEEYRTRLIADVVTGKLDVRKAAEELPQLEPTEITN